ncbi:MAG: gamma-glutamyl-gamma-aminobutyrate hydrolase family protein [Deltaproteobacteria bacterium]|nr:gamma-glutamyl-gamma-aminobutyrate hydrolase family protein [Deltaproteobacteria bacterium]
MDFAVVEYPTSRGLPLFGVCRGLQVIQTCSAGPLKLCSQGHAGQRHAPGDIAIAYDRCWSNLGKSVSTIHWQTQRLLKSRTARLGDGHWQHDWRW